MPITLIGPDPYVAKISFSIMLIALITGVVFLCAGLIMYWNRLTENFRNEGESAIWKFRKLNSNEFAMTFYGVIFLLFALAVYVFKING